MKNLMTLFTLLFFTVASYAQTATVKGNQDELAKTLSEGYVEFVMPEKTTNDDIKESAQYYTDYFTVDFNEETHIAKVNLNDNKDQLGIKIIQRFLLSSGVRTVNFNDKDYSIAQFYNDVLKE